MSTWNNIRKPLKNRRDEVCLPDQVSEVYGNIACKDKAFLHFDSAHIEGIIDDPEGYMDGVEKFLGNAGL